MRFSKKFPRFFIPVVLCLMMTLSLFVACGDALATAPEGKEESSLPHEEQQSSPEIPSETPSMGPSEEPSQNEPSQNEPSPEEPQQPATPIKEAWYYNGIRLGIKDESHSKEELLAAVSAILEQGYEADGTLTVVKEKSTLPALSLEEAAQKIAQTVCYEYTKGCALYVNDLLFAVAENKSILKTAIDRFLAEQTLLENQRAELRGVTFTDEFPVKKTQIMDENEVVALLGLCGHIKIEQLPGVNYDTIDRFLEAEELPEIAPVVITEQQLVLTEDIPFTTTLREDASKYEGYRVLYQQGAKGARTLSFKVVYENGVEVSRVLLSSVVTLEPTEEIYIVGALAKGSATGTLMWPTKEGYISSQYGYRHLFGEYKLHGGLDIAIVTGTSLYAADGGKVIHAGDAGNTYGTYVIIDHGNGMKTLYAHMSKVSVKAGDLVNKGDLIGKSGATGRVTGPHLHFEVRIDGARKDPANYLPATR